jgi:hypothetical protein
MNKNKTFAYNCAFLILKNKGKLLSTLVFEINTIYGLVNITIVLNVDAKKKPYTIDCFFQKPVILNQAKVISTQITSYSHEVAYAKFTNFLNKIIE